MSRNFKVLLIALVVIVLAGGAYAFAAANTVESSAAGYKASVVSGYAITNVVYDLNDNNPALLEEITFDVAPLTGSVRAAFVKIQTEDEGTWINCLVGGVVINSQPVTCEVEGLAIDQVTALNVVASSSVNPLDGE
jgi:hypothetical protein